MQKKMNTILEMYAEMHADVQGHILILPRCTIGCLFRTDRRENYTSRPCWGKEKMKSFHPDIMHRNEANFFDWPYLVPLQCFTYEGTQFHRPGWKHRQMRPMQNLKKNRKGCILSREGIIQLAILRRCAYCVVRADDRKEVTRFQLENRENIPSNGARPFRYCSRSTQNFDQISACAFRNAL